MLYSIGPWKPITAGEGNFVAPNAAVIGQVRLGRNVSIWFSATVRGDTNVIEIGDDTNVQDNAVIHVDDDAPAILGKAVTVGHAAVVHGCKVGDGSLIGIGSTILSHARIGEFCIVGAGALVTEHKEFPDRSLIIGIPAKRIRSVTDEEVEMLEQSAAHYASLGRRYLNELESISVR